MSKLSTLQQHKYLFFFAIFVVPLIVFLLLLSTRPTPPPLPTPPPPLSTPTPHQPFPQTPKITAISPGKDTLESVLHALGQPIHIATQSSYTILSYPSAYNQTPHEVIIKNNKVILIKEKVNFQESQTITTFLPYPKSKPTIKYDPSLGETYPIYIYPKDGLAFEVHASQKTVYKIYRFAPTNLSVILSTWGNFLVDADKVGGHRNQNPNSQPPPGPY